jgi:hypothetical protein
MNPGGATVTTVGYEAESRVVSEEDLRARHEMIKYWIRMFCIWMWPAGFVSFLIAFALIAGFVPPPSPAWSAARIAQFYAHNRTGIRIGMIGSMFGSALLLPFFTIVSAEIRKIEGPSALLAPIQFGGAVILVTFFQIISLAWLLASYRPGISPEIIRALNDYCWFVWSMLIPTYIIQFACMAVAGFMDIRPHPLWPRWAAYLNLWVALTGAGGVLAVFFKKGPFAWNGVVGFWIPVIVFVIGMSVTAVLLRGRVRYETRLEATSGPEVPPTAGAPPPVAAPEAAW